VTAGVIAAALTITFGDWRYAAAVGWDATAIVFSGWIWMAIWPLSASKTAEHATEEDPSRAISDLLILFACVGSLAAVGVVLVHAHSVMP
jgi:uncharacterized membrane protein